MKYANLRRILYDPHLSGTVVQTSPCGFVMISSINLENQIYDRITQSSTGRD